MPRPVSSRMDMESRLRVPARFPSELLDRSMAGGSDIMDPMIQLELAFAEGLDAFRLSRAVYLTLEAEPVLACRFVPQWWRPYWERLAVEAGKGFVEARSEPDFEAFKVASLDTCTGPQLRVCLWNSPAGARLLIKVSHCAADAAGVRDVARLISSIYSRLDDDRDFRPEPNLKGSRSAWQVLRCVPRHRYPGLYLRFLRDDARARRLSEGTLTLPFHDGPAGSASFTCRSLPQDSISRLADYGRQRRATVNDLLLAAFFRALAATAGWEGRRHLRATTTIDLRRYLVDRQASAAVANLSLWVEGWPDLGTDLGNDFSSTLERVTSITGARKKDFVGVETLLGLLLGLGPLPWDWAGKLVKSTSQQKMDRGNWAPAFTNTGPIDPDAVSFGSRPYKAILLPPPFYPRSFIVGASSYDGALTLSTGAYSIQRDSAERFLDAMVAELPG